MLKRSFDILVSVIFLILLFPLFILIALMVVIDSNGGIFYTQIRIARGGKDFGMLKFRTMQTGADKKGLLTIGGRDPRVTRVGYYLRKYKFDEFPQLMNVLLGDMSLVGPRPEVRKYVDMYTEEQMKVLTVRQGITDFASIEYARESELLTGSNDPEQLYIKEIMPAKLKMNLRYVEEQSFRTDLKIIFMTIVKIWV